jgi:hypothetical protein
MIKLECTTLLMKVNDMLLFSDSLRLHTNISFLHSAPKLYVSERNVYRSNTVTDCGLLVITQKTTLNSIFYRSKYLKFHINTIIFLLFCMVLKGLPSPESRT